MASRDHTLDGPIIDSAMAEFLDRGFEKASMRKIAAAAGATVGAIYTRYPTKDQLFCALVQPLLDRIDRAFSTLRQDYYGGGPQALAAVMDKESQTILHLLFDDYQRAVLLLCRSRGSSLEHLFDGVVERKIRETERFFRTMGTRQPDSAVLKLLLTAQFQLYAQVIDEGFDLEEAKRVMQVVMRYHTGGWLTLLGLADHPLTEED